MNYKIISIFLMALTIISCKKEVNKIEEISTIGGNFFIMKSYEKNITLIYINQKKILNHINF